MNSRTVLLIDGDSDSLNIYSLMLEHHGFRVLRAAESEQGFELARAQQPDLVILEPFAPLVRGDTMIEALRKDERTAHLPVLLITAVPAMLDIQGSRLAARDRFLTKPCHPTRLLEEVEHLLGPRAVSPV